MGGEQAEGEAADDEEPTKNVELKGSKDTEIVFSGKSKVAHLEGKGVWGAQVIGTLTVRKDIPSGKHWLQVNGQQVRTRVIPFVSSGTRWMGAALLIENYTDNDDSWYLGTMMADLHACR